MMLNMELRKIWKPQILLIIAVTGMLYGFLFLNFPLQYFPNGHPMEEQYQLMLDWTEKYGREMDEAEYQDALKALKSELGVTDQTVDGEALIGYAAESDPYLQQWAGALYEYETRYESLDRNLREQVYAPGEQIRVREIIQAEKRDGILPYEIMGNASEYWRWVSVFIILSVMILLAPAVTKDVMTGVRKLQYASKWGRKILNTQFFAALLSALGIVILEMAIFGALYARLGTWRFWNNPINSFFYGEVYWFDLNLGQYLLSILLLVLLFAGGAAGIAFAFSCFSRNYISLMLKIIPAFFLLGTLSNKCVTYLFGFDNPLYQVTDVKGAELYVGVIVLMAGAIFSLITLKHKSKISDKDAAAA